MAVCCSFLLALAVFSFISILRIVHNTSLYQNLHEEQSLFSQKGSNTIHNQYSSLVKSSTYYYTELKKIESEILRDKESIDTCINKKLHSFSFHLKDTDECFGKGIHDSIYAPFTYTEDQMLVHYPFPYNLIINEPNFCNKTPSILFVHPTQPGAFKQRYAIRNSFGQIESIENVSIKHIFIMGIDLNKNIMNTVQEESNLFHDLLVYDFQNSFLNVTLNVVLAMEWTIQYCPTIHYFIRSDTDTWINTQYIVNKVLPLFQTSKPIFAGYEISGGVPIRNSLSRYYISSSVYPNSTFPPYPTGCFYIFSMETVKQFYKLSQTVKPVLYFDDVYLGILNQHAHIPFHRFFYPELFFNRITYSSEDFFNNHMASHRYTPGDLLFLWSKFIQSSYNNVNIQYS